MEENEDDMVRVKTCGYQKREEVGYLMLLKEKEKKKVSVKQKMGL